MMRLNNSILEIEVRSPSELIKKLERNVAIVKDDPSIEDRAVLLVPMNLSENLSIHLFWRPIYGEDGEITNL